MSTETPSVNYKVGNERLIQVTEKAANKLASLLQQKGNPGGALRKTVLVAPWRNRSRLKLAIALFSMRAPKNGSHRTPPFSVMRLPTRHVSWAYRPR